jgi:oligosaccharyltransferase complex subunit gamma
MDGRAVASCASYFRHLYLSNMKLTFAGILAIACGALQALASPNNASGDTLHQKLVDLAAKNGGVVPLDESLFEKITSSNREWSVALQFTALSSNMKCAPCR